MSRQRFSLKDTLSDDRAKEKPDKKQRATRKCKNNKELNRFYFEGHYDGQRTFNYLLII